MGLVSLFEMRPVGQGAFIRGQEFIYRGHLGCRLAQSVRWIYDCGTAGKAQVINDSIADLELTWIPTRRSKKSIDVLVVSHFDKDHISGLPLLLSKYRFQRVFMPQSSRLERLAIGLSQLEDADDELIPDLLYFLDDPVDYIGQSDLPGDTTIVLVEPRGVPPEAPPSERQSDPSEMVDPSAEASPEVMGEITRPQSNTQRRTGRKVFVKVVASGCPFIWMDGWEIVPYVDPDAKKSFLALDKKSRASLDSQLDNLLALAHAQRAGSGERKDKLQAIKRALIDLRDALYKEMGKSAKTSKLSNTQKNDISLMAYMGPTHMPFAWTRILCGYMPNGAPLNTGYPYGPYELGSGVLLTGDANLKAKVRVDRLQTFLGKKRLRTLGIFQVPHHGSKNSSGKYTAKQLGGRISLINANPSVKPYHPDANVPVVFQTAKPFKRPPRPPVVLVNDNPFEAIAIAVRTYPCWHLQEHSISTQWDSES